MNVMMKYVVKNMKQLVEWELAEETDAFAGNLPQWHIVNRKSNVTWAENTAQKN
jgi:hypothetical protein